LLTFITPPNIDTSQCYAAFLLALPKTDIETPCPTMSNLGFCYRDIMPTSTVSLYTTTINLVAKSTPVEPQPSQQCLAPGQHHNKHTVQPCLRGTAAGIPKTGAT
jgi:hypothetical protein